MGINIETMVKGVVMGILGIVLVFLLVGNFAPTIQTSSDNISGSGLPLSGLFAGGGIVQTIFMVGILIGIIGLALNMMKKQ